MLFVAFQPPFRGVACWWIPKLWTSRRIIIAMADCPQLISIRLTLASSLGAPCGPNSGLPCGLDTRSCCWIQPYSLHLRWSRMPSGYSFWPASSFTTMPEASLVIKILPKIQGSSWTWYWTCQDIWIFKSRINWSLQMSRWRTTRGIGTLRSRY